MSYLDFVIRKEHQFLRNILGKEKLKESASLGLWSSYYNVFTDFI